MTSFLTPAGFMQISPQPLKTILIQVVLWSFSYAQAEFIESPPFDKTHSTYCSSYKPHEIPNFYVHLYQRPLLNNSQPYYYFMASYTPHHDKSLSTGLLQSFLGRISPSSSNLSFDQSKVIKQTHIGLFSTSYIEKSGLMPLHKFTTIFPVAIFNWHRTTQSRYLISKSIHNDLQLVGAFNQNKISFQPRYAYAFLTTVGGYHINAYLNFYFTVDSSSNLFEHQFDVFF